MRSLGEDFKQPLPASEGAAAGTAVTENLATLTGAVFSLRQKRHRYPCHDEGRMKHSHAGEKNTPSEGEDIIVSIHPASVTEVDGSFGAVVALDRYYGCTECPVLHVRVSR